MKEKSFFGKRGTLPTIGAALLCAAQLLCACDGLFKESPGEYLEDYGSVATVSGFSISAPTVTQQGAWTNVGSDGRPAIHYVVDNPGGHRLRAEIFFQDKSAVKEVWLPSPESGEEDASGGQTEGGGHFLKSAFSMELEISKGIDGDVSRFDISPTVTLYRADPGQEERPQSRHTVRLRCNTPPNPIENAKGWMQGERFVVAIKLPEPTGDPDDTASLAVSACGQTHVFYGTLQDFKEDRASTDGPWKMSKDPPPGESDEGELGFSPDCYVAIDTGGLTPFPVALVLADKGGLTSPPYPLEGSQEKKNTSGIFYVDAERGADSNTGTSSDPLRSLGRAVSLVNDSAADSPAGEFKIILKSDVVQMGAPKIEKDLTITSTNPASPRTVSIMGSTQLLEVPSGVKLTALNVNFSNTKFKVEGTFTMNKCAIAWTGQGESGKGVTVEGGTLTMEAGSSISGFKSQYGGAGVFVSTGGTFNMKGGTIKGNSATGTTGGGGVYVGSSGTFNMEDGTIGGAGADAKNTAEAGGGGVYVASGGHFTMSGGTISDNTAAEGGGVYVDGGTVTMTDSAKVNYNTATTSGGGFHISGGTLTLKGKAEIGYNKAEGGGGVYVENQGFFIMEEGDPTVKNNNAKSGGGGVYVDGSTFTMDHGTITENNAYVGGGVYVVNDALVDLKDTISGNHAQKDGGYDDKCKGGGVFVSGGYVTMYQSATISGNTAYIGGGAYVDGSEGNNEGTFEMQGGKINGNKALTKEKEDVYERGNDGGGVYVGSKGVFTMGDGGNGGENKVISENWAYTGGGICAKTETLELKNGEISRNHAQGGYGGGLFLEGEDGIFEMTECKVNANMATKQGGGIMVNKGNLTLTGGSVTNNTAAEGGGVYRSAGAEFQYPGCTISDNTPPP